jgi:hypothetical protein
MIECVVLKLMISPTLMVQEKFQIIVKI